MASSSLEREQFRTALIFAVYINIIIAQVLAVVFFKCDGELASATAIMLQCIASLGWGALILSIASVLFQYATEYCYEKWKGPTAQQADCEQPASRVATPPAVDAVNQFQKEVFTLVMTVLFVAGTISCQVFALKLSSEKGALNETVVDVLQMFAVLGWFVISTTVTTGIIFVVCCCAVGDKWG